VSVEAITDVVVELGYVVKMIKTTYFCRLDVLFEESLVKIQNDDNIRELMAL